MTKCQYCGGSGRHEGKFVFAGPWPDCGFCGGTGEAPSPAWTCPTCGGNCGQCGGVPKPYDQPSTVTIGWPEEAKEAWRALVTLKNAADAALVEAERKIKGYQHHLDAAQQIAGKALGYPWFKDDQKNFPGATEADGVCIGEHVGDTIVEELAQKYLELKASK